MSIALARRSHVSGHGDLDTPAALVTRRRRAAERRGRVAEWLAAILLVLMGYRLLGRRLKTGSGEIDIVAVRGRRLAFVEVKRRASWREAEDAVRLRQTRRLHRAAETWAARRPYYREHERGYDTILVVPWAWPSYRRDALQPA